MRVNYKKILSSILHFLKRLPGDIADFLYRNLWACLFYMYLLAFVALFIWNPDGSLSFSGTSLLRGLRSAFLPAASLMIIRGLILICHPGIVRRLCAGTLTSIIVVISFSEIWLSFMLHTRWSDRLIRLIADTGSGETEEFLRLYLLTPKSIGILLGFLLFTKILYDVLRRLGRLLGKPKGVWKIISRIGVICLLALGYYWWSLPRENDYNTENSVNTLTRIDKMVKVYNKNLKIIKTLERTPRLADGFIPDTVSPPARIIWVIGESDSKAHWSLYGYRLPTTPEMQRLYDEGNLLKFEDVICYEPRTYRMMEILFSPHVITDSAKYYFKRPLTPMILRKAGYTVRLHDNQATLVKGDDQAEVGTCNFMNSIILSNANFDYRNDRLYRYDKDLLNAEEPMLLPSDSLVLDIFHLNGQHFSAVNRYPENLGFFTTPDYSERKGYSEEEKRMIAEYDNATRYVDQVLSKLAASVAVQDAIIIYHPDHGEEMNDERHCHVRTMDSHKLAKSAPYVLEIPFIIYTTPKFRELHPDLYSRLQSAAAKPQSLIYFSHLLLDIAGVESQYKRPEFSPLSPKWSAPPRIVKDIGSYDKWRDTNISR